MSPRQIQKLQTNISKLFKRLPDELRSSRESWEELSNLTELDGEV
jgi:hypothetical protein